MAPKIKPNMSDSEGHAMTSDSETRKSGVARGCPRFSSKPARFTYPCKKINRRKAKACRSDVFYSSQVVNLSQPESKGHPVDVTRCHDRTPIRKFVVKLDLADVSFLSLRIPDHSAKHLKCKEEHNLKLWTGPTCYFNSKLLNFGGVVHLTSGWQDLVDVASEGRLRPAFRGFERDRLGHDCLQPEPCQVPNQV